MSFTGTIKDGVVILPPDICLPSGTIVRVEPLELQTPTLWETLKDFDGIAQDLPADFAS